MGLMDKGMEKMVEKLTPVFEARFQDLHSILMQILAELQKINMKLAGGAEIPSK